MGIFYRTPSLVDYVRQYAKRVAILEPVVRVSLRAEPESGTTYAFCVDQLTAP